MYCGAALHCARRRRRFRCGGAERAPSRRVASMLVSGRYTMSTVLQVRASWPLKLFQWSTIASVREITATTSCLARPRAHETIPIPAVKKKQKQKKKIGGFEALHKKKKRIFGKILSYSDWSLNMDHIIIDGNFKPYCIRQAEIFATYSVINYKIFDYFYLKFQHSIIWRRGNYSVLSKNLSNVHFFGPNFELVEREPSRSVTGSGATSPFSNVTGRRQSAALTDASPLSCLLAATSGC